MSVLDDEIAEQPAALSRLLDAETASVRRLAASLRAADVRSVVIAARGSSDNAARYAKYLFGVQHGLPVALAAPSIITLYGRPPRLDGALVIGVSQSGRSPDVISVLEEARRQGRPVVAVTNDPASPLAQAATDIVAMHAGRERSVAATKTYLCSLAALAMLSAALHDAGRRFDELRAVPELVDATLRGGDPDAVAGACRGMDHCAVVGRGFNYATAYETALKLKELAGVIAEPYSPPDLLHGPVAAVGEGFPVILVAPEEPSLASVRELVPTLAQRGARLVVISGDRDLLDRAELVLPLGTQPAAWLTPLVAVVPGQRLAVALARARSADPERPPGLRKVTETR